MLFKESDEVVLQCHLVVDEEAYFYIIFDCQKLKYNVKEIH